MKEIFDNKLKLFNGLWKQTLFQIGKISSLTIISHVRIRTDNLINFIANEVHKEICK